MSIIKFNILLAGRSALFLAAFLCVLLSKGYAQLTGDKIVCQNDVKTYTFNGNQSNCFVTWSLAGGVFQGADSGTSASKFTNSSGISTVSVKWTGSSSGSLSVTANCLNPPGSLDITIDDIPLTVSASSSTISLGQQVTLTATSVYTPSYSWTATANGNLSSASGSTITATPNATSTYTCQATVIFDHISSQITCRNSKAVTVNVAVPPITGNTICCAQCVEKGTASSPLIQASGTSLGGGNGTAFTYQWQRSTNGTSFINVSGATGATLNPGVVNEKTWFRRMVGASGISPVPSNSVLIEPVDINLSVAAASYSQNTALKAMQTITIQGDQTPAADVQVNFEAGNQVVVLPSTRLLPNIIIRAGTICGTGGTSGRVASPAVAALSEESVQDISEQETSGEKRGLLSAYPNPSHEETTITYTIVKEGNVRVTLVNALGITVRELVNTPDGTPGDYELIVKTHTLDSGLYYCILEGNGFREVRRLSIKTD